MCGVCVAGAVSSGSLTGVLSALGIGAGVIASKKTKSKRKNPKRKNSKNKRKNSKRKNIPKRKKLSKKKSLKK